MAGMDKKGMIFIRFSERETLYFSVYSGNSLFNGFISDSPYGSLSKSFYPILSLQIYNKPGK